MNSILVVSQLSGIEVYLESYQSLEHSAYNRFGPSDVLPAVRTVMGEKHALVETLEAEDVTTEGECGVYEGL
jgi:hypothetical protein